MPDEPVIDEGAVENPVARVARRGAVVEHRLLPARRRAEETILDLRAELAQKALHHDVEIA